MGMASCLGLEKALGFFFMVMINEYIHIYLTIASHVVL